MFDSTSETPKPSSNPQHRGIWGTIMSMIAIALVAAVIGGVVGSAVATRPLPATMPPAIVGTIQQTSTQAPLPTSPGSRSGLVSKSKSAAPVTTQAVDSQSELPLNTASSVFQKAGPSVVQVIVSAQTRRGQTPTGSGSGVVVDENGYILTNYHVVSGASNITVVFSTGDRRTAEVLGTDRGNDLALLKVDLPETVPAAKLGDSDLVLVGEEAIAIGSPFGLAQTVTQGIISAVNRDWRTGRSVFHDLIQTDAPINPGNSGGPLLNANAEVIGITSMIESPIAGSVSIGFAIPINKAKALLPQLEAGAHLQRAWLGISGVNVDQSVAEQQGLDVRQGVLVTGVVANSAAAKAGLHGSQESNDRSGDVIVGFEDQPVVNIARLVELIGQHQPKDIVQLTIIRQSEKLNVAVTLQAWPDG